MSLTLNVSSPATAEPNKLLPQHVLQRLKKFKISIETILREWNNKEARDPNSVIEELKRYREGKIRIVPRRTKAKTTDPSSDSNKTKLRCQGLHGLRTDTKQKDMVSAGLSKPSSLPNENLATTKLDDQIYELIAYLHRLQEKARSDHNKPCNKRRMVVGVRETYKVVSRAAENDEEKETTTPMIIIARDITSTPENNTNKEVDKLVRECQKKKILCIHALTRKKLARAAGKQRKACVIGVIDIQGCRDKAGKIKEALSNEEYQYKPRCE
jgi:ribosomal protein L7Ae-like RNA K-turn-binding protein